MSNEITLKGRQFSLVDIRRNEGNQFPRIKTFPKDEAVERMRKIILNAFLYRGQVADPDNVSFVASNLLNELLGHRGARNLSWQEVAYSVKKALLNDELFGISVVTLYKAIIKYVDGEGRQAHEKAELMKKSEENYRLGAELNARLSKAAEDFTINHTNK